MLELRGLVNPQRVCVLFNLNQCEGLHILFLLETKLPTTKLDAIKLQLGMHACIGVNNEGERVVLP